MAGPPSVLTMMHEINRRDAKDPPNHKEPTETQVAVDRLVKSLDGLHNIPKRQLRALIALLDLRILNYANALTAANDGATVSRLQGQVREASELMALFRTLLDRRVDAE